MISNCGEEGYKLWGRGMQNVERKGTNSKLDHLYQRIGRRKEASNRGGGIQSREGSSTSHFVCVSHSTLL
jgi:hypothetical protein